MKLVTYVFNGQERPGVLTADGAAVLPLPYSDMQAVIEAPAEALRVAAVQAGEPLPLSSVTLLAPIPRPRQDVICLGINYLAHADESTRYDAATFGGERPVPILSLIHI